MLDTVLQWRRWDVKPSGERANHLLGENSMLNRLACLIVVPVLLHAQEFRATITGRVTDQSNSAVASVAVQVRNVNTNEVASGVTDNQGNYTVPFLRPGNYTVSVEAPGFQKPVREGLTIHGSQAATINISVQLG